MGNQIIVMKNYVLRKTDHFNEISKKIGLWKVTCNWSKTGNMKWIVGSHIELKTHVYVNYIMHHGNEKSCRKCTEHCWIYIGYLHVQNIARIQTVLHNISCIE